MTEIKMTEIKMTEIMNPRPWTVSRAETQIAALLRKKDLLTLEEAQIAIKNQMAINLLKHNEGDVKKLKRPPSKEDVLIYFVEIHPNGYKAMPSFTEGLAKGGIF